MNKKILASIFSLFLLLLVTCGLSQDYDLIVTTKGDSIACRIDSSTNTHLYYEMIIRENWTHTQIGLTDVSYYKRNAVDRKHYIFRSGTSIIESRKPAPAASMKELQKNSVYVGIGSLNYARLIPGDRIGVTFAGGFSFVASAFDGGSGLMIETTLLIGGTKHFFEPGILGLLGFDVVWPMIRTGYRYQGPEGFLFRAAPLFGYMDGFSVLPAISIGYSFLR